VEVIEEKIQAQKSESIEFIQIMIKCPVCKLKKKLKFPKSVINGIAAILARSLPGAVAPHWFRPSRPAMASADPARRSESRFSIPRPF